MTAVGFRYLDVDLGWSAANDCLVLLCLVVVDMAPNDVQKIDEKEHKEN